jgi:hypothetical protein
VVDVVEDSWPEHEHVLLGLVEVEIDIVFELGHRAGFNKCDRLELDFQL